MAGRGAGRAFVAAFDERRMLGHQARRYVVLTQQLQEGLDAARQPYGKLEPRLYDGLPAGPAYGARFRRLTRKATRGCSRPRTRRRNPRARPLRLRRFCGSAPRPSRSIPATSSQAVRSARPDRASHVARTFDGRRSASSSTLQAGRPPRVGRLVARYGGMVWAVARAHRLCDADAADASQATWLKLLEHIGEIKEPSAVGGWLATTARRECLRILRRASRVDPLEQARDRGRRPGARRAAAHGRARRRLWRAFEELGPRDQALLRMLAADPAPATRRSAPRSACRSARSGPLGRARSSGSAARSTASAPPPPRRCDEVRRDGFHGHRGAARARAGHGGPLHRRLQRAPPLRAGDRARHPLAGVVGGGAGCVAVEVHEHEFAGPAVGVVGYASSLKAGRAMAEIRYRNVDPGPHLRPPPRADPTAAPAAAAGRPAFPDRPRSGRHRPVGRSRGHDHGRRAHLRRVDDAPRPRRVRAARLPRDRARGARADEPVVVAAEPEPVVVAAERAGRRRCRA